jgi:hypothetical protein
MFEQVPTLPVTLHALQLSVQSVSQQKPSAQWPVAQSVKVPQLWPTLALQTWFALHACPELHESSAVPAAT